MMSKKITMYWKYVKKRNIVFCLILTELFLLKYIYKHTTASLCVFLLVSVVAHIHTVPGLFNRTPCVFEAIYCFLLL